MPLLVGHVVWKKDYKLLFTQRLAREGMAYIKFLEAGQNISCRTPVTSFAIDEGEAETKRDQTKRQVNGRHET